MNSPRNVCRESRERSARADPETFRASRVRRADASGRVWSAARRRARKQAMRRLRRIKILATLGPASSDSAMIRRLFEAGADVFRINMSHTSHDKMRELVKTIRKVESSYGRPIGHSGRSAGPKTSLRLIRRWRDPAPQRRKFCPRFRQGSRRQHPRSASAPGNSGTRSSRVMRYCSTTARYA